MTQRQPSFVQAAVLNWQNPEPTGSPYVYGWTHYGMAGQTKARMNKETRELEIRDGKEWTRCDSGGVEFFFAGQETTPVTVTKRSNP